MTRKIGYLIASLCISAVAIAAQISPVGIRGDRIFTLPILKANGGVVLQAVASFVDSSGKPIQLNELSLNYEGTAGCVMYRSQCFVIPTSAKLLRPLASWVARKRTSAFSMAVITTDPSATNFISAELKEVKSEDLRWKCTDGKCYVPPEFNGTELENSFWLLDFTEDLEDTLKERSILKRLNARPGVADCAEDKIENGSYINTDVDSDFVVVLSQRRAQLKSGTLFRYGWYECKNSQMPFIYRVSAIRSPSLNQASDLSRAIYLARAVALLRSFENRPLELARLAAPPPRAVIPKNTN
jgi:hypothetical protein